MMGRTSPITRASRGPIRKQLVSIWKATKLIEIAHRAHSKTVGGIPIASDTFLFQKQQTFNRSKNLERVFHLICSL